MAIWLPEREIWTRQPTSAPRLSSGGINSGLLVAQLFGGPRLQGAPLARFPYRDSLAGTTFSGASRIHTNGLNGTYVGVSNYFYVANPWDRSVIKNQLTSLLVWKWDGQIGVSRFIAGDVSVNSSSYNWGHYMSSSTKNLFFFVTNTSASAQNSSAGLQATVNSPQVLVGTYDGARVTHWQDGIKGTPTALTGNVQSSALWYAFNRWFSVSSVGGTYFLHCLWNRCLGDSEIKLLSANPWQIFE